MRIRMNRRALVALSALISLLTPQAALAEDTMSWPSEEGQSRPAISEPTGDATAGESGQAATETRLKPESAVAAPAAHAGASAQNKAPATAKTTLSGKAQTMKLFGRIDQIAGEANVEMPVLKMEKAQLDAAPVRREAPLRAAASESRFSGSVATSFPMDFSGTWGGTIKVWRFAEAPLSYEIDPAESRKLRDILSPGTSGDVNFVFQHAYGKIDLEPAQVRIMIPASQSYSYQKMMQSGGQMEGMGGMVSQMMANMKVPVILHFGTVSTSGSMEVGVSGNQIDQRVVKNDIRQLAPEVVEEQIVTQNSSVQSGGRSESGYTESVLRFTRQSPTQLYVLAASVDYDRSGKFMRKLIMYGNVVRGQVMNTSPVPTGMGNLTQMMQGMEGGGGGANGMAQLSGILNSLSAGGGQQSGYGSAYGSNPAVRQYLNSATSAGGGNMEGFGQLMNSLNMLNR